MMLETVTGKQIDIENPDPALIDIEDIAWGLSRMPRFCGHTITVVPYNVAQHSVFVANEALNIVLSDYDHNRFTYQEAQDKLVLKALLHDAAEVYTGDLPSPLKRIPSLHKIIKQIEDRLMAAIYKSMNLTPPDDEEQEIIKLADRFAQKIEAHAFMPSRGKDWPRMPAVSLERLQQFDAPLDSLTSYKLFMQKFIALTNPD